MKKILIGLLALGSISSFASSITFCQNLYLSSDERQITIDQLRSVTHFRSFTDILQIKVKGNTDLVHRDGLLACNDDGQSYILVASGKIEFITLEECNKTIRAARDNLKSAMEVSYDSTSKVTTTKISNEISCK